MATSKAGKLDQGTETQNLVSSLNCGGLLFITQPAQNIFFHAKHYFRQQTSKSGSLKTDIAGITETCNHGQLGDIMFSIHALRCRNS